MSRPPKDSEFTNLTVPKVFNALQRNWASNMRANTLTLIPVAFTPSANVSATNITNISSRFGNIIDISVTLHTVVPIAVDTPLLLGSIPALYTHGQILTVLTPLTLLDGTLDISIVVYNTDGTVVFNSLNQSSADSVTIQLHTVYFADFTA